MLNITLHRTLYVNVFLYSSKLFSVGSARLWLHRKSLTLKQQLQRKATAGRLCIHPSGKFLVGMDTAAMYIREAMKTNLKQASNYG